MTKKIGPRDNPDKDFGGKRKRGWCMCGWVGVCVWEKGFAAKLLHVGQRGKGYASHGSSASDRHH